MNKYQAINLAKSYIDKIKKLEDEIHVYEVDIVKIALGVCDIRHGGKSPVLYTIRDFAIDIDINPKTLQNWIAAYRNVVPHLKKGAVKTKKDWSNVRKTNRFVNKNSTEFEVRAIHKKYDEEEKPFIGEFRNAVCATKNLKHLLKNRDMKIIDNAKWIELMEILDHNSDTINDYLTGNK